MIGSGSWTRTNDPVVNSHLLYQLSYAGIIKSILKVGRVRIELTQPMAPVLQTGVTLQLYRLPRNQSDPGGVRTHDHRIKSPVLYQLSYRVKKYPQRGLNP